MSNLLYSMGRPKRTITLPARYVTDNAEYSDEGGLKLQSDDSYTRHVQAALTSVLQLDSELEIDLVEHDLPSVTALLANADSNINLHQLPIDDPSAEDPQTIKEAQHSIYWAQWLAAIYEELEALKAKGVYEEVDSLPPDRRPVGSKWVLHIKRNSDSHISRFKARLVAKGFTQIPGQDFTYTFAPVARWDSIRTILVIAAFQNLELRHIDIKTAFLNGPLDEEIYMRKPEILGPGFWRLLKGLYGLKQAGRSWYLEFNEKYESLGFKRCQSDWSVHVRITRTRNPCRRQVSMTSSLHPQAVLSLTTSLSHSELSSK